MLITTVGSGMLAELGLFNFEDDENVGKSCSGETGFLTGLSGRRTQAGRTDLGAFIFRAIVLIEVGGGSGHVIHSQVIDVRDEVRVAGLGGRHEGQLNLSFIGRFNCIAQNEVGLGGSCRG